ncbi:chlorophyllide a oxygenase [Aureococcus anophagefferens]|nr:chlorophyllide a oxygenase [Aureococcus anophagefferens]
MAEPQPEAPPSPRPNIKGEYKTPAAPKPATCDLHDVAKDNNDPPPQKSALLLMVVVPAVVALYACLVAAGRASTAVLAVPAALALRRSSTSAIAAWDDAAAFWAGRAAAASGVSMAGAGAAPRRVRAAAPPWAPSRRSAGSAFHHAAADDDDLPVDAPLGRGAPHEEERGAAPEDLPAGLPERLFVLAASDELVAGAPPVAVEALGREYVLWRGATTGLVGCLDAYCPHMGAHLGVGGTVVGDCARCPMHLWTFAGDGTCADVPYTSKKIPAAAHGAPHAVHEWYGNVFVWFHADGAPPSYELPKLPMLSADERRPVRYCGSMAVDVDMHIAEFAENSADFAHFQPLHGDMVVPWFGGSIPLVTVKHVPGWSCGSGDGDDDGKQCAWFLDHASLKFNGADATGRTLTRRSRSSGPPAVFFTFETPIGGITLFHCHTPLSPLKQKIHFSWYADLTMPSALVWYVVGNWIAQWQADVFVWSNTRFCDKAVLVQGDGPLPKLRRFRRPTGGSEAAATRTASTANWARGSTLGARCFEFNDTTSTALDEILTRGSVSSIQTRTSSAIRETRSESGAAD